MDFLDFYSSLTGSLASKSPRAYPVIVTEWMRKFSRDLRTDAVEISIQLTYIWRFSINNGKILREAPISDQRRVT